jgi:hypothetical protein
MIWSVSRTDVRFVDKLGTADYNLAEHLAAVSKRERYHDCRADHIAGLPF